MPADAGRRLGRLFRGEVLLLFALGFVASGPADARDTPKKSLVLAPGRSICISATTGDVEALPAGTREIAARAAYRRLLQEVAKRGADQDRVLYTASPAVCDAARGDVIIRSDLRVERAHDRYVLTLTAGDGVAQRSQSVRRENVKAWGAAHARFPDPPAGGTDVWPDYFRVAVRIDSADLASAVIRDLKIK